MKTLKNIWFSILVVILGIAALVFSLVSLPILLGGWAVVCIIGAIALILGGIFGILKGTIPNDKYIDDPKYPHRLSAMLEKLPADQAPSTFAQGGRFIVTSKVFAILEQQGLSRDGELWFSDASNTLAKTDVVLTQAFEKDEDWLTTGDPLRWLKANIIVGLQDPNLKDDLLRFLRK
jgi:UTP-glucose-1-phosphate uridylyltransferase